MSAMSGVVKKIFENCLGCSAGEDKLYVIRYKKHPANFEYHVECEKCGTTGPKGVNTADAIRRWNNLIKKAVLIRLYKS